MCATLKTTSTLIEIAEQSDVHGPWKLEVCFLFCGAQACALQYFTGFVPNYLDDHDMSVWSRGMIPASGAGGPGFNPRNGPVCYFLLQFA